MQYKLIYILLFISYSCFSQEKDKEAEKALTTSKNFTWEANKELSQDNFISAEANYRKAIHKSDKNIAAPYNLGNAYYNKESYYEAFSRYKQAAELADNKKDKHRAYHNMGNVFLKNKEYEKAVNAYKQALRNNPKDEETRYNLALAKELLKKQQEENKKNDQNKDDKNKDKKDDKDQKEDKNKGDQKDQDKKEKGDKGDQKEKDKNKGEDKKEKEEKDKGEQKEKDKDKEEKGEGDNKKEQKEEQQPRPNQLSKQQVKNLLEAMQNEEKKVQQKMDAKKVKGANVKNEKDW